MNRNVVAVPATDSSGLSPLFFSTVMSRSVTFTIPSDSDYSCRFRNSPRPIELIIVKTVINDDGGTAVHEVSIRSVC